MNDGLIAWVNQLGADQPLLLTFYNQLNWEIRDVDKAEPIEESPAEEMPGVIVLDLRIQDNTDMVEDNIKITGVYDDPVDDPEPKIDLSIDPPENPILPENPKDSIDGTAPTYETTIK